MANRNDTEGRSVDAEGQSPAQGNAQSGGRSRSNRGFASMDRSKQREIASKGGRAAHSKGTAHEFDSSEAREAGRKGGLAVSRNREHMAAIGRRGGEARGQSRGRGAGQVNTQGTESTEGGVQNSRTPLSDREVGLPGHQAGAKVNPQGQRGGTNSIGGEKRPDSDTSRRDERESYGNR